MASYRLSLRADEDLSHIYEYGIMQFGQERADRYYDELIERLEAGDEHETCQIPDRASHAVGAV